MPGEDARQQATATAPGAWPEIRQIEPEVGSLIEGPLELTPRQDVGEVDQGAGGGCDRDAVPRCDVALRQVRPVDDESATPASLTAAGHGDIDARPALLDQAPEDGRSDVTQRSGRSTAENSSNEAAFEREGRPPDGVDALVHP